MNFICLLKKACNKFASQPAVIDGSLVVSYRELWAGIDAACSAYQRLKIKKGDRILIVLPNNIQFLYYCFAAMKMGAVPVPVKGSFKSTELSFIVENSKPRVLLTTGKWIAENCGILDALQHRMVYMPVDDNRDLAGNTRTPVCRVRPGAPASILYSYTGSGYPKGAVLTHANWIYASTGYYKFLKFKPSDKFLVVLPMPHVFTLSGCIASPLLAGSTIVIINDYSPKSIFAAIGKYKITILTAIPVVFEYLALFKHKDRYDGSSLRLCITGGDWMPGKLQEKFAGLLQAEIVQGYGLTECFPVVINPPGPHNKPGSLGIPGRNDIKVKVTDHRGCELERGSTGEIVIKSPTNMSHYFNLPDDTKTVLKNGWLYTGDLGRLDADGYLHFCGLKKRIFNLYGDKVDPVEIQNVLSGHPCIEQADVYLKNRDSEECILNSKILCTDIHLKDGQAATIPGIREYCNRTMAAYKIPEIINIIPGNAAQG